MESMWSIQVFEEMEINGIKKKKKTRATLNGEKC